MIRLEAVRRGGPSIVVGIALLLTARTGVACPFCFGSQQLTLRERIETPDAAVLVEWQRGNPGDIELQQPSSTTFTVRQVWRGDLQRGAKLTIDRFQEGAAGEQFLLTGNTLEDAIRWDRAIPLSPVALEYVRQLPPSSAPIVERLRHALAHLESTDLTIANDAFDIIAASKYEELVSAREHLDVDALRRWVHDPQTIVSRLGVYGMLLGLAGGAEDVGPLRKRIFEDDPSQPIRIGIDGVMGGFLLLTGSEGLRELEASYLLGPDVTPDNLNAVTSALRFMWEYGDGLIPTDRLRDAMRLALNHESVAELAIIDLARWKDWTVVPRLVAIYRMEQTDDFLKRRIIGFLIVASQETVDELTPHEANAVRLAAETLETIRLNDGPLYQAARRGLILR